MRKKKIDDGGSIFPEPNMAEYDEEGNEIFISKGLSLRDWFAGNATDKDVESWLSVSDDSREQARYNYADAMISQKRKDEKQP